MNIAVVGAKGMIGSALMKYWNPTGDQYDELIPLDLPEFDICSRPFVLDSLNTIHPDVIINATGINLIDWLEIHPNTARHLHIHGVVNLREAAKRLNAFLVQFSCSEVFFQSESFQTQPFRETDLPDPESVYAKTKLESERVASEWNRHLIIRTSVLFGPSGENTAVNPVESLLKSFTRTHRLHVIDDHLFSPTSVIDVVTALRFLFQQKATGLFHIANQGIASLREIAEYLKNFCGLKRHEIIGISLADYGYRAPHSLFTALDTAKYRALPESPVLAPWQHALTLYMQSRQS